MPNPPTIDYGRPEPRKRTHPVTWGVLALFMGLVLATPLLLPLVDFHRHSEDANQARCASNLRRIGQAIMLYATDNGGNYPPDLQTVLPVLATGQIGPEVFTCPSSIDTKASTPAGLSQPNHCSYIYVGANLTVTANPDTIVAIEDPANHNLEGANVLFADGHLEWQGLPEVMQSLNDLALGKNPPGQPTMTLPAATSDYEKNWKSRMPQLKTGVWAIPTTRPSAEAP